MSNIQDENARQLIVQLLNLIEALSADLRDAQAQNQRLRDEINWLKGEQGKPKIKANTPKPPRMDYSSEKERRKPKPHQKRVKKANLEIHREQTLEVDKASLPPDAEFKGYEDVVVQDLVFRADNVCFHKEKYWAPSTGQAFLAPLPLGYEGQFGPGLKALIVTLYFGGGILNSGTLTVSHCVLLDNHATGSGGGLRNQSSGTVTVAHSVFSGNSATGFGGGLANYGTLTVTHSQFTGNTASQGGGLSTTMSDAVSVANCTFSDNNAIDGAGLNVYGGTAVVTNCTFSGNTATGGDGAGIHVGGTVTVTNSTLSGNRWGIYSNGNATVRNTIRPPISAASGVPLAPTVTSALTKRGLWSCCPW